MSSDPSLKLSRWLLPLALLLACLWPGTAVAQDKFNGLFLIIKVVKNANGTQEVVPDAEVKLVWSKNNATGRVPDDRIATTDYRGVASLENTEFDLSEGKTVILTVTAKGYKRAEYTRLSEDLRRLGGAKTIKVNPILLEPEGSGATVGQNQSAPVQNTNTAPSTALGTNTPPARQPFDWFGIPAFVGWLVDGLNTAAFWVGWLAILYLLWRYALRPLWRRYLGDEHPADSHGLPPEEVTLHTLGQRLRDVHHELLNVSTKQQRTNESLKRVEDNQKTITTNLNNLSLNVSSLSADGGHGQGGGATFNTPQPGAGQPEMTTPLPFKERAHLSYLKLAEGAMPDIDPLYAKADAKSTLFGKLADSNVYLLQEGHRQAAFVLFTEDGKQGWVFPNPALAFRPAALKDVFPYLTEGEFESAKERIEPARVARVDEVRWTVKTDA